MKRREFVGLLGLLGLTGCQVPSSSIPGRLVGASFNVGHLLRQGDFPPPDSTRSIDVAILGGGVAGLSAAWKLARSGVDNFRLFELEGETGGNARFAQYPVSAAPWGAHYLPIPTVESRAVRELLQDMGVMRLNPDGSPHYDEEMLCFAPQERLYMYGHWYEGLFPHAAATHDDMQQLDAFYKHVEMWKARRDSAGRKAFAIPLAFSSPQWRDLDRMTMADYMTQQGWTSPRLRWYVDYACRDDYGSSLGNTSAWAGLHYYASRDGGGYRADPNAELVWPEGNGFLIKHLRGTVGERVSTGTLVYHVDPEGVTIDTLDVQSHRTLRYQARYAIYAAPRFTAWHTVAAVAPNPAFTYAPWVVANVVLDAPPADVPGQMSLCWDNVAFDSPSLGYVVATHQSLKLAPGGTVLTWYRAFPETDAAATRQKLLARPWESYRDEVMAELQHLHPDIRSHVQQLDVMLWGHGMIRPQPGFIWGPDRKAAQVPIGRLHFAHSDMSGISIFEEAQYHGVQAAQAVMASMQHPFPSSL